MTGGLLTLALEASTYTGSVSLSRGAELIASTEVAMRGREQERLMPAVAEVLRGGGVRGAEVERIVCGAGPGSFTSLRIAAAIAKGLATSWRRPLVPLSSLGFLVASATPPLAPGTVLAVMDALRDELYVAECAIGDHGRVLEVSDAGIVPAASLADDRMRTVGAGRRHEAAPRAAAIVRMQSLLTHARAADLEAWEPAYGRLAEAQVRWESAHGRALANG